ncbi:MAG: hypothetical protein AVDCRST_MAG77-5433 [uncultured Chloroflexi bacterium]|uniref:Polymerase/histidinol phosphatase N-terminal domain-containing protein n=1 Tax=uncultured Chloroflexota bacterium TaxID=166587 RepID=A0A6J4K8J6_9CHLR|nr:MAG: hypothetical protein AVDCRST_MAG77-5433 [uncultured Chloroflexota bacterium]
MPWQRPAAVRLPADLPVRDGLRVDWHCHSRWSDGQGTPPELIERAESMGVTLGISDHGMSDNPRLRTPDQVASYLAELSRYPVRRGIELSIGEPLEMGNVAEQEQCRFDYAIASLHAVSLPEGTVYTSRYLNWRAGLYPSYRPSPKRYDRRGYFEAVLDGLELTASRWPVRILGHFCLLPELATKHAGFRLDEDPNPDAEATEWLDAIIQLCLRRGIAVELNSKSRAPHMSFIKRAVEVGARFSCGSDAHQRHRAGDLSYGLKLAAQLGIPADRFLAVSDVLTASAT